MGYAHPEVLVGTNWVVEHLKDSKVRVAEVDYDPTSNYNLGHVPGAVLLDWKKDFNNPLTRDIVGKDGLERLLGGVGVKNDTTVVLYGDFNNWFAAFAFWILKYYGAEDVRLMDGGRMKWIEEDRPMTKDVPKYTKVAFTTSPPDDTIRVYMDYVRQAIKMKDKVLVDVRSPQEFTGEVLAPPEYPNEHAQRGGHIPGAANIPWGKAVNEDGTFKAESELRKLYEGEGVTPDREVLTYCRIGERSSHSWFVLKYLLGYPNVKNYDGSWTEWGNQVRTPIER